MCLLSCVIFFILSFIKTSNTLVSDSPSDSQNEYCKFTLSNGEVIDLSPLIVSGQLLTASSSTSLYIYHPCRDVALKTAQVSECQKSYGLCYFVPKNVTNKLIDINEIFLNKTQGSFTLLARNSEAVFLENQLKSPEIVYKHSVNDSVVSTYIRLQCNENVANYTLTKDKSSSNEHVLTLTSVYVCVHTAHYMSGGTVFFIILLVFVTIYFVGGILVLKYIRGATGVEMIPNHEFWCSLPTLAMNGFKYVTSCGKSIPDSYEKI